ncbi:MAG: hypothetical protein ACKO4X_23340, partial [Alphaproteobacteria bacterium]
QTATHIFGLALAMSRAFAPRIQHRQEGTMASTAHWPPLQQFLSGIKILRHVASIEQRALV